MSPKRIARLVADSDGNVHVATAVPSQGTSSPLDFSGVSANVVTLPLRAFLTA